MKTRRPLPRVLIAWLLFFAFSGFVLFLGSERFSHTTTVSLLGPLIDWLFPDWSRLERWQLHFRLRKLAHPTEYALLALLAFHAVFVTLETLLARITALALLLVLAVAATDELRQAFLQTRTGSLLDVALDLSGALVALLVVVLLHQRSTGAANGGGAP